MRHESPPNAIFIANRQGSSMCTLITGPSPVPRCKHCRTFDDRVGRQHEAAEVSVRFFVPLTKPSYAPVAVEANRDIQPARAQAISARGYWTIKQATLAASPRGQRARTVRIWPRRRSFRRSLPLTPLRAEREDGGNNRPVHGFWPVAQVFKPRPRTRMWLWSSSQVWDQGSG